MNAAGAAEICAARRAHAAGIAGRRYRADRCRTRRRRASEPRRCRTVTRKAQRGCTRSKALPKSTSISASSARSSKPRWRRRAPRSPTSKPPMPPSSRDASALREQSAALGAQREGAATRLGLLDANAERAAPRANTCCTSSTRCADRIADAGDASGARAREAVAAADAAVETARRSREANADEAAQKEAAERIAPARGPRSDGAAGEDRPAPAGRDRCGAGDAANDLRPEPGQRRRSGATSPSGTRSER